MLCRDLGRTQSELLETLTAREMVEWEALHRLEYEERQQAEAEARTKANASDARQRGKRKLI